MRKPAIYLGILSAAAGLILATSATAQPKGVPQRPSDVPPGLAKVLDKDVPGIIRALQVTYISNSRLQDLPVSP